MTGPRTYRVPDMSCNHCKDTIERDVGNLPAVAKVEVDLDSTTVTVTGEADDTAIRGAIEAAGYNVAPS